MFRKDGTCCFLSLTLFSPKVIVYFSCFTDAQFQGTLSFFAYGSVLATEVAGTEQWTTSCDVMYFMT
jgi:hypothetical protein